MRKCIRDNRVTIRLKYVHSTVTTTLMGSPIRKSEFLRVWAFNPFLARLAQHSVGFYNFCAQIGFQKSEPFRLSSMHRFFRRTIDGIGNWRSLAIILWLCRFNFEASKRMISQDRKLRELYNKTYLGVNWSQRFLCFSQGFTAYVCCLPVFTHVSQRVQSKRCGSMSPQ